MAGASPDGLSFFLDNTPDVFQIRPGFLASFPGGLLGLGGKDRIFGSPGADTINGNQDEDNLSGSDGADAIFGGQEDDILSGNQGDDGLVGGRNDDILFGGQGNDNLLGFGGDDILVGDLGTDILSGGKGEDIFILRSDTAVTDAAAADVINDFGNGFDRIGLTGGLTEAGLTLEAAGADTLIRIAASGGILGRVVGVAPAQVTGRFVSGEAALAGKLGMARDIGVLNSTQTFSDFVGEAEKTDIYRFVVNAPSNFTLALNGLGADADVDIIQDFNGNNAIDFEDIRGASLNGGTDAEAINLPGLAAGTYFARVFQTGGDTNYNLSLSATPA